MEVTFLFTVVAIPQLCLCEERKNKRSKMAELGERKREASFRPPLQSHVTALAFTRMTW